MANTVFEELYPNQLLYRLHMGRKVKIYMRPASLKKTGRKQYIQVSIPRQLCSQDKPCRIYVVVVQDDRGTPSRTSTGKTKY